MLCRSPSKKSERRNLRGRLALALLLALLCLFPACSSLKLAGYSSRLKENYNGPLRPSPTGELGISHRTRQTLRTFDLEKKAAINLTNTIGAVRSFLEKEPTLDLVFAVAELSFLEGRRRETLQSDRAAEMYLLSAYHAYGYLFDPKFNRRRNSYDPHFREACLFYNRSFERMLRLLDSPSTVSLEPDKEYILPMDGKDFQISCRRLTGQWGNEPLEPFKFAADFEVKELKSEFRQYGLGVPLLGQRQEGSKVVKTTKYTPTQLCFPVTALLRFLPPGPQGQPNAVIELYDPLTTIGTTLAGQRVPLESDLTTPLAYSISDPRIAKMNTLGLLRSDLLSKPLSELTDKGASEEGDDASADEFARQTVKGLYLMQPFEPGKIPVIFVHGIWSSPSTWVEMFNTLRSEPELRERYQFFFYFYPTGQPFWVSAAQLRDDLEEFRRTFDPQRTDPSFDDMVLVGHSMGGLLSTLQTIDSGYEFWKLVSNESPQTVLSDNPEATKWFFFRANPSIRRVVTIATPFEGSPVSNDFTQWFAKKAIRLPESVRNVVAPDERLVKHSLLKVRTSIDSLSPNQPIFETIQRQREAKLDERPIHYHNIVGEIELPNLMKPWLPPSDGVVRLDSATLEHCDSQISVPCEHTTIHAHPKTILEVRRILFEHLREARQFQSPTR